MNHELVFLASTCAPQCNNIISKHLVGYATIQYMERGEVELAYDGKSQLLKGAWFWPAYPGPHIRFHAGPTAKPWFHRHLAFQGPLYEQWKAENLWPQNAQKAPLSRTAKEWGEFFDQMSTLSKQPGRLQRLRAINMMESLLLELALERKTERIITPWMEKVLLRLKENWSNPINYEQLAQQFSVSEPTLRRHFKKITGLPIHSYVLQLRVTEACTLLSETEMSLKAVAHNLGYTNVYFFSRQFKKMTGVSPGEYRRSAMKK